jgi:hypothetical protein
MIVEKPRKSQGLAFGRKVYPETRFHVIQDVNKIDFEVFTSGLSQVLSRVKEKTKDVFLPKFKHDIQSEKFFILWHDRKCLPFFRSMLISNGITDIITAFTDNGSFCQVTSATVPRSYLICGTHGEFITKLRYARLWRGC